jgi:Rrf2 family transcriptional regulator, iron-sulfur cluster assembly transcription factor
MSVIFSRQCEHALQAVIYLALKPEGEKTSAKELTARLKVPYHFIGKILQDLTKKKLLVSLKGPHGGFGLGRPPEQITLLHIVDAVDGSAFAHSCALGFKECADRHPCSVHDSWKVLREEIYQMLARKNIAELAVEMKQPGYAGGRARKGRIARDKMASSDGRR